jgi:hypothetical protein
MTTNQAPNPLLCALWAAIAFSTSAIAEDESTKSIPIPKSAREHDAWGSLPPLLAKRTIASGLSTNYSIDFGMINPFYLQGDFDGDGRPDYVTRLKPKKTDSEGQDIMLLASGAARWLSKDIGRDYPRPSWYVVLKHEKIPTSPFENKSKKPPKLPPRVWVSKRGLPLRTPPAIV